MSMNIWLVFFFPVTLLCAHFLQSRHPFKLNIKRLSASFSIESLNYSFDFGVGNSPLILLLLHQKGLSSHGTQKRQGLSTVCKNGGLFQKLKREFKRPLSFLCLHTSKTCSIHKKCKVLDLIQTSKAKSMPCLGGGGWMGTRGCNFSLSTFYIYINNTPSDRPQGRPGSFVAGQPRRAGVAAVPGGAARWRSAAVAAG